MKGWVDLGGWLFTEMVYPSKDSHRPRYYLRPFPNSHVSSAEGLLSCGSVAQRADGQSRRHVSQYLSGWLLAAGWKDGWMDGWSTCASDGYWLDDGDVDTGSGRVHFRLCPWTCWALRACVRACVWQTGARRQVSLPYVKLFLAAQRTRTQKKHLSKCPELTTATEGGTEPNWSELTATGIRP